MLVSGYYAARFEIPEDYYLYNYSDTELKDILFKRDEYENPEEVKTYIIFGYILAVTGCILSLAWGLLLLASYGIATAILTLKKQLPNGERVYYFKEATGNTAPESYGSVLCLPFSGRYLSSP